VIADAIRRLAGRPEACAFVMYRSNFLSRPFEDAAIEAGIPYRLVGDTGFYGREEIRDALAWVAFMLDRTNSDAFRRIISRPACGIGAKATDLIAQRVEADRVDIVEAGQLLVRARVLNRPAADGVRKLSMLAKWFDEEDLSPSDKLDGLLERAGYREWWRAQTELAVEKIEERLANLKELVAAAEDCSGLAALLERATRAGTCERSDARLRLMTMHGAKGLEAEFCYLVRWNEGLFPPRRAVEDAERRPEALDDERRLGYVGLTRPRVAVAITHSYDRPCRFLSALPEHLLTRIDAGSGPKLGGRPAS
jgi:DNA helicase-2/ATP-dependent DNA helicase PcrA